MKVDVPSIVLEIQFLISDPNRNGDVGCTKTINSGFKPISDKYSKNSTIASSEDDSSLELKAVLACERAPKFLASSCISFESLETKTFSTPASLQAKIERATREKLPTRRKFLSIRPLLPPLARIRAHVDLVSTQQIQVAN